MLINASPASRSLDMVDLRYVFNFLSVLNEYLTLNEANRATCNQTKEY